MIEKTLLQVDTLANWVERCLVTSGLTASVVATSLTAGYLLSGSQVTAAEVDAIGTPAPLGFADIVERVKPTVVGIRVKIEGVTQSGEEQQKSPFPPGSPFDRYLRQFGIPHPDSSVSKGMAMGAGFFISGDGYVVTNNHVLANGTNPEVMTDNGTIYSADVIGADQETDLALIKVSAGTNFPYVRLARDPPRIGDWVLPIGNPFGLGGSVTAGIVSARGRDIGEGPYDDFIQIDAPVNVGDSGGPSFNVKGEVIGVNTAIFSPSGGSVGVAFDIPAETVKFVVQQLKDKGYVTRGWIGVELQAVTPEIADAIGLKNAEGTLVVQLEPDSPAVKGGVEVADAITSVNNESVKDTRDLVKRTRGNPAWQFDETWHSPQWAREDDHGDGRPVSPDIHRGQGGKENATVACPRTYPCSGKGCCGSCGPRRRYHRHQSHESIGRKRFAGWRHNHECRQPSRRYARRCP